MTATPGSAALLALAERLEELVGWKSPDGKFYCGVGHITDYERDLIVAVLRLAAKPDEDGVRDEDAKDIMLALLVTMTGRPPLDTQLEQIEELFTEAIKAYRENFSTTGHPKP